MSSSSQIIARNTSQIERAWHVLTILIRLGRPASPSELASRSALDSIFLSRGLIEFLCLVPGSPISLSQHRFVTASQVAVESLSEFLNRSSSKTLSRLMHSRMSELRRDLRLMHSRKRKARPLEAGLGGPTAKRRVFLGSERNVEELGTQKLPPKAPKPLPVFSELIMLLFVQAGLEDPHPNANSHHVHNEMKMLERFGGRNFVIKYEGSFKSGQSECFVLEHVEHDRPEVLKKEIDVFELQWYGYCMFRALASLHKQGIVHRDVKPGNFLFSRKLNKGYLIDFNLASDLHQKNFKSNRAGSTSRWNSDPTPLVPTKSALSNISKEVGNDSRKILLKDTKKRSNKGHIEYFPQIDNNSKRGSQAADSGVTSAKEATSTRTHSADRLKHVIPYKGRKELINFVQEAMQSPTQKEVIGPVSQRKRIAAPLGNMNRRLMILTPMPLHSGGNAVAGAGGTTKGNGKHKREGPCVGTKGFRAPEVLFKSFHQGFKVDIWSAGVTLLYLIIGKSPFGGDPEQNIKEIAKLRGSEDLWEVAKLHDCESSYPSDLFAVQYIRSMKLRDWCRANTKRPEFLELVPQSMLDLIDKCLTVNPRCRITADEALMHTFFNPCHESLRKQRLLRRTGSDSTSGIQPLPSVTSSNDIETSIALIVQ